jgi:hypothetical protein
MDSQLVGATWGLVVATALLVVAAAVPLFRDAADRREQKRRISARLIPDMNILRARFEDACNRFADSRSFSDETIQRRIDLIDDPELNLVHGIITEGERPSLIFANEIYIVRHLLTQAKNELRSALKLSGKMDANDIRARDDALVRVRRLYKAALTSLDAAERVLPTKVRTIKGESFWDRFERVSLQRESEAGRSFIDVKRPNRRT